LEAKSSNVFLQDRFAMAAFVFRKTFLLLAFWVFLMIVNMISSTEALAAKLSPNLPAGFEQKSFVTSDQVRLSYYEAKPNIAAASTLLFVPGWSMPGWIWFDIAKQWANRHRVIVFDPRGQGKSDVAASGYEYKRRAADIAELIAACNCSQITLVGWSLGGLEALQYTHQFQAANLAALILVDHSVGVGKPPSWDPTFFNRLRADHPKAMAGFVRNMFAKPVAAGALKQLTDAALHLPLQPALDLLSQPVPREFWRDAVVNAPVPVLYLVIPKFAEQAQIIKELKERNTERNLEKDTEQAPKRNASSITIRVFDGLGHALFIDDATGFNAELGEMLKRSYPAAKP
jgi:non-heme chloroperoxidase